MNTFFKSIITVSCLAGVALATTSCLERVFSESEPTLSTDVNQLVISSDSFEGAEILNDTIFVTSNRSWSANFIGDVDWVSLDDEEHLNLAKCSKVFPLVIRFSDNKAEVDRTATLRISTEFSYKEIKITQRAISYRLVLDEGTDERLVATQTCYTAVTSPEEDSFVLAVNSNMPWTAKLLANTANATIDKTEGLGIEDIKVSFPDNDDRVNAKTATLILSSKGSDDIKVEFTQPKSEPFARVLSTDWDGRNVSSMGGRVVFTIKSNADFVIKVKDGEELKGGIQVARRDQSGAQMKDETDRLLYDYPSSYEFKKGTSTVTVACFGNTDFDNDKTITFQLIAEEKTVKEHTLTLDKLSKVFVGFRKYPHSYNASGASDSERNYDPFNINLWVSTRCPSNNPEIDAFNGYHFVMHTFGTCYPAVSSPTARTYLGSGKGLVMGAGYHYTCVTLPAVPGKKLATVTVGNGSTSVSTKWLKYGIVTPECAAKIASFEIDPPGSSATLEEQLTTVSGGEFVFCAPTVIKNVTYLSPEDEMAQNTTATTAPSWHTFELSGTQENTAYTLVCLYATTIRWIDLQYK